MKRYLSQYLWVGLAALLVIAALFVPQGWFALRDAASLNRTHGETMSPLMVAQLNRSYERDINERMNVFMNALDLQDVICSSKEIDPGNESLWENIRQAESSLMMEWFMDASFIRNAEAQGWEPVIESCVQYVLMRQSDGQILMVANDIYLDKGDGCYMELLLDGVDGTVYYLESMENNPHLQIGKWMDGYVAWYWWQMLNADYHTKDAELLYGAVEDIVGNIDKKRAKNYLEYEEREFDADAFFDELTPEEREAASAGWVQIFSDSSPHIWVLSALNKDIYCCQLYFGEIADSWAMETEKVQNEGTLQYRIRLGLSGVVQAIPEMAERISLAKYDQIYQ